MADAKARECAECGSEYDLDYGDGLCHQCAHVLAGTLRSALESLTAERDAAVTVVEAVHEYLSHAPGHMTRILFAALAAYDAAKRGT